MKPAWHDRVERALAESTVKWDAPLHQAVTLRVGGPAECLVELESEADLKPLFALIEEEALPFYVLGKGSNVLVRDEGLPGIVIRLGRAFGEVCQGPEPGTVIAGAGLSNAAFVDRSRKWGLGGMEFLVAIPGSIGGAIAMNAGAHDGETATFLRSARVFSPESGIESRDAGQFEFAYRSSPLRADRGRLVLEGVFGLRKMSEAEARTRQDAIHRWRRDHQPRDFPNCGSVFKNPPGDFAARLIDMAGLKGRMQGGAQVSEKHANFIVNRGGATADDVLALVDFIRETVYRRNGVELELEMQVIP